MIRSRLTGAGGDAFRAAAAFFASLPARDVAGVKAGADDISVIATDFARAYASWTDRTGAARRGLHPVVQELEAGAAGGVGHDEDLDYVGRLETVSGGRFGIIPRAQEVMTAQAPAVFAAAIERERSS